jgi:hypothetical protein
LGAGLNPMELQAKLMVIIGLIITAFFIWVNEKEYEEIYAFKGVAELGYDIYLLAIAKN